VVIYLRHGKTGLNLGGAKEALRGWLPVPLTAEGRQQADAAGKELQGLHVDSFSTSDLPRAMETSARVSKQTGVPATPDYNIRDWNTGHLAGQKYEDVKDELHYHVDHPDEPIPGGESLNDYLNRFVPAMRRRIEDPGVHLVTGHARGTSILQGIASPVGGKGLDIDATFLKKRPDVDPGQMIQIPDTWDIDKFLHQSALGRLKEVSED
jgi:broad specificity phosphatase PhoE